jgi:hypothetical protein
MIQTRPVRRRAHRFGALGVERDRLGLRIGQHEGDLVGSGTPVERGEYQARELARPV